MADRALPAAGFPPPLSPELRSWLFGGGFLALPPRIKTPEKALNQLD